MTEPRDPNLLANVSLGLSVILIILWIVAMFLGCIPIVGLVALLLYPIEAILAVGAIITGFLGYQRSQDLDGSGAVQALMGGGIAACWTLFQLAMWCLGCGVVAMVLITENM